MHNYTARQLHQAFTKKQYRATEIATHFLQRIREMDPQIGAFLATYEERALNQAKALDAKEGSWGPLAGVPIAIKDNIHVAGELTTCASRFLENYRAPFSATVIERLEKAGAIILGKTNLDEFAMGSSTENSAFKKTRNPINPEYTPGGSSGGSAAAVAARMAPLALGSDTGGSIRQPASFTGTYGFKPTYGRVSRYGLVAFGSSFDQIGPFANSAEDIAYIMETLGHPCSRDSTSLQAIPDLYLEEIQKNLRGKTLGIPYKFMQKYDEASFNDAIKTFESLGVKVIEIDLKTLKYSIPVYYILSTAEASTNLARFDGVRYGRRSPHAKTLSETLSLSREEGFGPEVKQRILLGAYVLSAGAQDAYYRKAQKVRTLVIEEFKQAFTKCDIIAMPTSPTPAFKLGAIKDPLEMYLQDLYTIAANLAGLPAISIPAGFVNHLPVGIQLIGKQLDDAKVLQFAHQFEKERT
ncbi:MAG: Asp-tRNA(Asn)/Glu-tRNA(Gln) amidotransferase subunit GatA [Simkaniaceae bacterium]|nr:Asp-tRNA(Asn)/Glu-tRNA(Gln) amidotransferase subunit GatA [Simkaniaceae bacterium]